MLVWRSEGPGFNSLSLPVLGMGFPDVVTGRGVGFRAATVDLLEEQEPSHKWEELTPVWRGENKLIQNNEQPEKKRCIGQQHERRHRGKRGDRSPAIFSAFKGTNPA